MSKSKKEPGGLALAEKKQQLEEPPRYRVLLHNDDYTTMDFVVAVLERVFYKGEAEANRIMLDVHQHGRGVAGVYPREVAETKVVLVHDLARRNEFPLRCSMEQE